MKRLIFALMVIALLVPTMALACHIDKLTVTTDCEEITAQGKYVGEYPSLSKAVLLLDGNVVASEEHVFTRWDYSITVDYSGSIISGDHTVEVIGYQWVPGYWKKGWHEGYWNQKASDSETVTVESCYEVCSQTTLDPNGEWSDWVWDPIAQDEVRTHPLVDAFDTEHPCPGVEKEFKSYKECSKVNEVVLNGHIEYRDVNTGKLCESKCRDRWVQQQYGLFALEGPNGEYATMYVYADENGKLPIGVSVQRQECVLGWVAVNTPYAGWVYKNPCTGEYKWNDQTFTPRRDVIKHGVCDRSQPCLVQ